MSDTEFLERGLIEDSTRLKLLDKLFKPESRFRKIRISKDLPDYRIHPKKGLQYYGLYSTTWKKCKWKQFNEAIKYHYKSIEKERKAILNYDWKMVK